MLLNGVILDRSEHFVQLTDDISVNAMAKLNGGSNRRAQRHAVSPPTAARCTAYQ
jgi:hypothetical protein